MAKKEDVKFDDINLDEIDFGADFDFGDGTIDFDAADDRSPIESFKSAVKTGLKDRIMDRGLIRRLLSFALPKGYNQAFNAYDSLTNSVADIYKDNTAELQPYMRKGNALLKRQSPMVKRLMPKGMQQALEDSDYDAGGGYQSRTAQDELNDNIAGLDQLLGMTARNKLDDSVKGAVKEIRERKEFETSTGISVEIGKGIGRLVQYQENVTINYQRKSLELKYRHLDVAVRTHQASEAFFTDARDLLKAVGHNTALPDFVKMRNAELIKEQLRHRLASNIINSASNFAAKHLSKIKENLSQSLGGALGTISAADQMSGGMSKSAMAGDALGGLASGALADMMEYGIKEALTRLGMADRSESLRNGGRYLQDKLSGLSERMNDYARSETTSEGYKGQLEDWFKRQMDSYSITDKINGVGPLALDKAANFDNLFHKSVTEVIPGYLASMEKWLRTLATGEEQEEHAYSHYTGGFVTRTALNKQHIDVGLKAGAGDAVRQELDVLLKDMGGSELSAPAKRALRARLMTDMSSNSNFDPKLYVKPSTWAKVDSDTAEELVEFFADAYGINIDGEYDENDSVAAERRTESRSKYLDLKPRITDFTGRMAGLSEVIGRRSWREMGLSEYDGREGDNILPMAVYDMIANEGGDKFDPKVKAEEEKPDPFKFSRDGLKDGLNQRAEIARRKLKEAEEEQARIAAAAKERAASVKVDVDAGNAKGNRQAPTIMGSFSLDQTSIDNLTVSLTAAMSEATVGSFEIDIPELLDTQDVGTHTRLDALIESLTGRYTEQSASLTAILEAIKENDPCRCEGQAPRSRFKRRLRDADTVQGSDAEDGMWNWGRARDYASGKIDEYDPKAKWDMARGYVTERFDESGARDKFDLTRNYVTGKLEESGVRDRFDRARQYAEEKYNGFDSREQYERARGFVTDKYNGFDARDHWDRAQSYFGEMDTREQLKRARDYANDKFDEYDVRGKAENARDYASDKFDGARDYASSKLDDLGLREHAENARMFANNKLDSLDVRGKASRTKDFLTEKLDPAAAREYWESVRRLASDKLGRSAEDDVQDTGEETAPADAPRVGLRQKLWNGAKRVPGMGVRGLGNYLSWSFKTMGQIAGVGASVGVGAAKLPFQSIRGLGVTDVYVEGDDQPSLTAKNIRRGHYFDVKSEREITGIKDITGPVKNRQGEIVITQEEFDKGLVSGDGESLAGWGLRKSASLGMGAAGMLGRYLGGSYGLMGRVMKGAFKIAADQFTQFDAYFPGDEEPRIRSKLMKQGFYRDAEGAPILSLKDIKGPVFDVDQNEVISQEEWEKYKSLYTRNGSVLFTVGSGMVTAGAWAAQLAGKAAMGYGKMVGEVYGGLWKGTKAVGRGVSSLTKRMFGISDAETPVGVQGGMETDEELNTAVFEVGLAQLKTQQSMLDIMRRRFDKEDRDKWDLDGDGDRDNSWDDIVKRRKEAKAEKDRKKGGGDGSSEDVVMAIDALGAKLEDSIAELGDRVEEAGEDSLLDQANGVGDLLGGGGDEGGRRRRGGRGGRGGWRNRLRRSRIGRLGGRIGRGAGALGRGAAWVGRGAMALGTMALGTGVGTAAMSGLAAGAATVGGWLAAGATAVAGVLTAPVTLAIAAVAAAAYIGYRWYKSSEAKSNPLFYLRMTQYGVDPTKESRVKQMIAVEELLLPGVSFHGDKASIDAAKINIPSLLEILEIKEGDNDRMKSGLRWLATRFRPVFLAHVAALNKTVKSTKLSEVDKLVDGSTIKEFLEIVDLKSFEKIYNDLDASPFDTTMGFGGGLDTDADDVEEAFKLVRSKIEEKEKPEGAVTAQKEPEKPEGEVDPSVDPAKAVVTAAAASAAGAVMSGDKSKAKSLGAFDIGRYTTNGEAGATPEGNALTKAGIAGMAAGTVTAGLASLANVLIPTANASELGVSTQGDPAAASPAGKELPRPTGMAIAGMMAGQVSSRLMGTYTKSVSAAKMLMSSLDIPTAVRYLQYGLTSFDKDKCKQLHQVEELYWDFLRFNGYDNALIEGDLVRLEDTVIDIFKGTSNDDYNTLMWLRYRFMPTFLQYAISVRRRLPGDVRKANNNLTRPLMREVLTEVVQAVDDDSGTSVWLNAPSPWSNYPLGKDSGVTTPYIEMLPVDSTPIVVQGFKALINAAKGSLAFGSGPANEGSNLSTGAPTQVKEDGGIFSNAMSSVKNFFGMGKDPGGTAAGANSKSTGGNYGGGAGGVASPMDQGSGPPSAAMGTPVTHPGGGVGGDINTLPNSSGEGWGAMKNIIVGAAKMAGFDPYIAATVASVESNFKPRAGAGTSSAKGLFQFINSTWRDMLKKYGKKYGIAPNTHQFDPRANALMGMEFLKENYNYLKSKVKNVPITDTSLYAAHFLGAAGARKLLTAPANANAESIVGSSAVKANASVFRESSGRKGVYGRVRTVAEVLAEIERRMRTMRKEHDLKPGSAADVVTTPGEGVDTAPQTGEGEQDGAAPDMDPNAVGYQAADTSGEDGDTPVTAAAIGGDTASTASTQGGGGEPSGGGNTPSQPGGYNSGGGSSTPSSYSTPPSPDPVAAAAAGDAVLSRDPDDDQGTFGTLRLPDGTEYCTLELPWRDNATGASCIPPGKYKVEMRNSPKFGRIYEVTNVPGRTSILIHSGNSAGDTTKGYSSHVEGCILLGLSRGKVGGQKAVQQSRAAIAQFNEKMAGASFNLTVVGAGQDPTAKKAGDVPEDPGVTNVSAADVGNAVNGGLSGSSAAVNTQGGSPSDPSASSASAPTPSGQQEYDRGPDGMSPTISQATSSQNQKTTAVATAEISATIGPILQEQLQVSKSMDRTLTSIQEYLKSMSNLQTAQQQPPKQGAQPYQSPPSKAEAAAQASSEPQRPQTSAGSGRQPLNTRRNNPVT